MSSHKHKGKLDVVILFVTEWSYAYSVSYARSVGWRYRGHDQQSRLWTRFADETPPF